MNQNMNVIFYSGKCKDCRNLLTLLENEKLLGYFVLFCVDGRLDELPSHITAVPTMIVANINKPLVCNEAFEWVNNMKFLRQQNLMMMNKKIIMQQNLMRMANKKGPHGFLKDEMSGVSDNFAYVKIDNPLPHTYVNINNDKNAIFTAPEQGKINKDEQKKRLKNMVDQRKDQDSQYSDIMKKQQMNAVLRAEQEKLMQENNI